MIRPLYPIPIASRPPRPPARRLVVDLQLPQRARDPGNLTLGQLFSPLQRRWAPIGLLALAGMAAALFAGMRQAPVYEATALLQVEGINEDFITLRNPAPATSDRSLELDLQTQVRILQSPELLQRVATKLDLWQLPEFLGGRNWFSYGLTRPSSPGSKEKVLRKLSRSLTARVSGQTRILEVEAESTDPVLASNLANTASQELIEMTLAHRAKKAAEMKRWLTGQLQESKSNLERSEEALQEYANGTGLLYLAETNSVAEAGLKQLQEALSKARQDRVLEQSRYDRALASPPDALPEVLDDSTLANYQIKLTDLNRQLSELSATLKPAHFSVKAVQAQIKTLQAASDRRRAQIISRVKSQYASALLRERQETIAYEKQISMVTSQAGKSVRYGLLKREVDTNRQMYELMLQKVKESAIASAARATNTQLFNAADVPQAPSKPILALYAAIGLLSGLFAGSVLALSMGQRGEVIRTPEDLKNYLGLPALGVIPAVRQRLNAPNFFRHLLGVERNAVDRHENWIELACCPPGDSRPAESIRAILASVLFSAQDGDSPRVIAVTSACVEEGKTTVATNIAAILAQTNQRVLLVDGHLRRPRLHTIFGLTDDGGLLDALIGFSVPGAGGTLALNCQPTGLPGLFLLPAGPVSAGRMNQLYSQSLPELFAAMRSEFDTVVIDLPPLSDPGARPLARMADGVLLVIRAARTPVENLREATLRLTQDGSILLGTVLNYSDLKIPQQKPDRD